MNERGHVVQQGRARHPPRPLRQPLGSKPFGANQTTAHQAGPVCSEATNRSLSRHLAMRSDDPGKKELPVAPPEACCSCSWENVQKSKNWLLGRFRLPPQGEESD